MEKQPPMPLVLLRRLLQGPELIKTLTFPGHCDLGKTQKSWSARHREDTGQRVQFSRHRCPSQFQSHLTGCAQMG